nr:pyruvate kinase [Kocuria rhizophila]
MPTDAARDPALVRRMVAVGMDVARINCAHDGPREWAAMLEHLRAAAAELGTDLRVAMDLAGPKVRTGPVAPGPRVEKIKPERDARATCTAPPGCDSARSARRTSPRCPWSPRGGSPRAPWASASGCATPGTPDAPCAWWRSTRTPCWWSSPRPSTSPRGSS